LTYGSILLCALNDDSQPLDWDLNPEPPEKQEYYQQHKEIKGNGHDTIQLLQDGVHGGPLWTILILSTNFMGIKAG